MAFPYFYQTAYRLDLGTLALTRSNRHRVFLFVVYLLYGLAPHHGRGHIPLFLTPFTLHFFLFS